MLSGRTCIHIWSELVKQDRTPAGTLTAYLLERSGHQDVLQLTSGRLDFCHERPRHSFESLQAVRDELPGLLGEIANIVGLAPALAIAERVGGTRGSIPVRAPDQHWLVETVGRDAADRICDHFRILTPDGRECGVSHVVIPRGPAGCLAKARRRLARELDAGLSAREAARRAGVSERAAFRMRARRRAADDRQGELFQQGMG